MFPDSQSVKTLARTKIDEFCNVHAGPRPKGVNLELINRTFKAILGGRWKQQKLFFRCGMEKDLEFRLAGVAQSV